MNALIRSYGKGARLKLRRTKDNSMVQTFVRAHCKVNLRVCHGAAALLTWMRWCGVVENSKNPYETTKILAASGKSHIGMPYMV